MYVRRELLLFLQCSIPVLLTREPVILIAFSKSKIASVAADEVFI